MTLTLVKAWTAAKDRLKAVGIDQPSIDARLLLEVAANVTRTEIVTDPYRDLTAEQEATLDQFLTRRERREPVSHIIGRKGFWKILLQVNKNVLTPRPETEVIVDEVLKAYPENMAFSMLDLGVGSGTILLAVLAERPAAKGLGVDASSEALAVARDNAANLDLNNRLPARRLDGGPGRRELRSGGLQPALHPDGGDRYPGARGSRPRAALRPGRRPRRAGRL
jgi:release factor glutamine methyltransferase